MRRRVVKMVSLHNEGEEMDVLTSDVDEVGDELSLDDDDVDLHAMQPRRSYVIEDGSDMSFGEILQRIRAFSPEALYRDCIKNYRRRMVYVGVIVFFVALIILSFLAVNLLGIAHSVVPESESSEEASEETMNMMDTMSGAESGRTLECGEVDSDGDRIGDKCDSCPYDPRKIVPGQCGCNVEDIDSDGDGLADCRDECPHDPNYIKAGPDGCGSALVGAAGDSMPSPYQTRKYVKDMYRWMWMRGFPQFVATTMDQEPLEDVMAESDTALWRDCWEDSDLFRINTDPLCTASWMRRLKHRPVGLNHAKSLSDLGDDEFTSAIRVEMPTESTPMRALFRPCISEGISYTRNFTYVSDVAAFVIDRILAFNRAPAAVPRVLDDSLSGSHVSSYFHECGSDGLLSGAMVGWMPYSTHRLSRSDRQHFPFFFELDDSALADLAQESFLPLTRSSSPSELRDSLEKVLLNMWYFLTGSSDYRYQHTLSQAKAADGRKQQLLFLGNNAAQFRWNSTHEEADKFAKICRFPEETARRILLLNPPKAHHVKHEYREQYPGSITLGGLVRTTLNAMGLEFLPRQVDVLDINVMRLATVIQQCIDEYGEDNVLLSEHRGPYERDYKYFETSLRVFSNNDPFDADRDFHDDDEY